MKLTIIMPIYNERDTIEKAIEQISSVDLSPLGVSKELIMVDDGSRDGTRQILKAAGAVQAPGAGAISPGETKIIYHEKNKGKGGAIRTGLEHATGDIVVIHDADLEYNPFEFARLVRPIINNKTDVVYGSRFMRKNPCIYGRYYMGNKVFSALISLLGRTKITDSYTCYKMMRRQIFKGLQIESNGFEMEAEITIKLIRQGHRILELPISYSPRTINAGKKIGWKDAFIGIYSIFKYFWRKHVVEQGKINDGKVAE